MDFSALRQEIGTWPLDDRIKLVEALYDDIAEANPPFELDSELSDELDRRLAELDANPDNVLTWEQIDAHLQRQR